MDVSWLIYKVLSTELWHRLFMDRNLEVPSLNERLKGAAPAVAA
jgi:hypothetical protein